MKKLKIISKYKVLLFLLIIILCFTYTKVYKHESKYYGNEKVIVGYVYDKKIVDNKIYITIKAKEKVIAYYQFINQDEIKNIDFNDYIKVQGDIYKPTNNTIPNLFNYKEYLNNRKIYYCFNIKTIEIIRKNNNIFYKTKNQIYNRLDKYKYSGNYLKMFIMGVKDDVKEETNLYQNLGIIHLLCISSMHISFFILLIDKMIKNIKIRYLLISLFLLIMLFITNYQISLLRASLCYFGRIINKKTIKILNYNLICIVSMVLLIINPFYLYDTGFFLSSVISFFINYLNENSIGLKKIFDISFISFFSSLPIVININYCINILSILLNVIYVPIVTYIIFPLSILTSIVKPLDKFFYLLFNKMNNILTIFDNHIFNISFSKIPIVIIIFYYTFLIFKKKKIIIMFLLLFYFINMYTIYPTVYYIDVGQGDSILIRNKNKNILIDTGGNTKYNISKNNIKFYRSIGIKKINYLILSHGDYDHMGEAINIVNNFKVEKVIFNCGEYNDLEKELIKILNEKKIKYYSCIKELNIDNNKFYFLQTKVYDNENDNSNVIYTELNEYKFMFMGDASITTEKEVLNKYNLPNIDVLKVGHHGSKTSSSKEFINEINPKYSIISVGKNNRYGHPNKEVLDNLNDSKVYRTDQDGSIMFKIKNKKINIETCSP